MVLAKINTMKKEWFLRVKDTEKYNQKSYYITNIINELLTNTLNNEIQEMIFLNLPRVRSMSGNYPAKVNKLLPIYSNMTRM